MSPRYIVHSKIKFPVKPESADYQKFLVSIMNLTANSNPLCGIVFIENIEKVAQELSNGISFILNGKTKLPDGWISINKGNRNFISEDNNLCDEFGFTQNGQDMQMNSNTDDWFISGRAIPYADLFKRDLAEWEKKCAKIKGDFKQAVIVQYNLTESEYATVTKNLEITESNRKEILSSASECSAFKCA